MAILRNIRPIRVIRLQPGSEASYTCTVIHKSEPLIMAAVAVVFLEDTEQWLDRQRVDESFGIAATTIKILCP